MDKNLIEKILGRIELNKIKAKRQFDAMGEKYMGKKKYRAKKKKYKL